MPGMTSVIRTRISRGPSVAGGSFHIATKGAVTAPSGCASRTLPSGCGRRASLPLPSQDRSAGRHSAVGSFGGGKGGGSTARTSSIPWIITLPSRSTSSGSAGSGTSTSRTSPRESRSTPSA